MKRIALILCCLFFICSADAQLENGFSIELGSAIWVPSGQNKAVALGLSLEPKYRFQHFGFALRYERGILGFGIDEFGIFRSQLQRPFVVREASLKNRSSIQTMLELYPIGFEDKIALRIGYGIYRRGRVPQYDLLEMDDYSLDPIVKDGICMGLLYNWKKTSAFLQLNFINKKGQVHGEKLSNYWSSGIVYNLNLKTKSKTNYESDEDRRLVFRVEFGPEVNIPIGKTASAAALGLYADIKFYINNMIYFGGSFSFAPNKRGHEDLFTVINSNSSGSGGNSINIISNQHVLSQIQSSSFIAGRIIKRQASSFIAIGGGPTLFESFEILKYINETTVQILPEKKSVGATIRVDYNLGYMNHSLTFNITPKELPFYIGYKTGIGLNFTKTKKK